METILFISSTFKGMVMMRTVKELGCRVLLLTEEQLKHEAWPRDVIDEIFFMPDLRRYQDVINAVSYLCRSQPLDQILPMDEFEVELTAILREHLRLPGMALTATRRFRDKLVMRQYTHAAHILVPEFVHILNYDKLRTYMETVPPPWVLKPRMEAGSMGLRKVDSSEQVWHAIEELSDKQSYYLLEHYIPGDVFHVDSLVVGGKVVFTSMQKYGAPPMDIYQGGGIFNTRTIPYQSPDSQALDPLNKAVVKALGLENGVTHGEYIKAHADGRFYFLEMAARVGGAFISDLIEFTTNINPWREWGRLEVALLRGEKYKLPKTKKDYGGLMVTLARQEHPDLSSYNAPEVVWKADKPQHAALIIVSKDYDRISNLLNEYNRRFVNDFLAVATPMAATHTGQTG